MSGLLSGKLDVPRAPVSSRVPNRTGRSIDRHGSSRVRDPQVTCAVLYEEVAPAKPVSAKGEGPPRVGPGPVVHRRLADLSSTGDI